MEKQFDLFKNDVTREYKVNIPIRMWAEEDVPGKKFLLKGKAAMTNVELLSMIIGSGCSGESSIDIARALLYRYDNNFDNIAMASVKHLMKIKGIGPAKAVAILSAFELGNRRKKDGSLVREKITQSRDIFEAYRHLFSDSVYEMFWIILLNRANRIIKALQVSEGGVSGTVADPKRIFKMALDLNSSGIICMHNHPSGNIQPSEADIRLTKKLKEGALLLDIDMTDHLIFGNDEYLSFKDEGLL